MVKIEGVKKGSIAENLGIKKGSYLVSIDDNEINDPLDLRFFESGSPLDIQVHKGDQEMLFHIEKEEGLPLGIKPAGLRIKRCKNNCIFCFINQNPTDVRKTLLIKDDDYRMSFLYGNYITLTNLTDKDFERIIKLKLSPLYISVHTTDPEKRIYLMKNKRAGRIMEDLNYLIRNGIKLHTQIVLLPGVNDGEYLQKTIEDLLSMYPSVESIGIVPVGLTVLRDSLPYIRPPSPEWMVDIIKKVEPYQMEMQRKTGKTVVYLADEFYLKAVNKIPPMDYYDDFPQLENGIGMVRQFLSGLSDLEVPNFRGRILLATGTLAYESILKLAKKFKESNIQAEVLPVKNRFFGNSVGVAGLIGGWDLLGRISILDFDVIILPPDIVNRDGLFIDGCSLDIFRRNLPMEIYVAPYNIGELGGIK
ncbi:MAG: DUF512 domain-containing protein [candidate division WOR-3 bacterium]|nr:DUF512 domain-containing protein [candidate division WOR-3 bacterium]